MLNQDKTEKLLKFLSRAALVGVVALIGLAIYFVVEFVKK